ncbi:MAG: hypothetical protein A2X08_17910 [Bacteroidetes bacterium GWA2_32_17]|nr:MAG: hypothetical protein A2X08_17910 [Bacteroidetes bacterium GWA2_32_17]
MHIAKKQIENEFSEHNKLLILDTDLIITKVWLLHVYKTFPDKIDETIKNSERALYLLCYPDLPWEYDKVRENPAQRKYFFEWYKTKVTIQQTG